MIGPCHFVIFGVTGDLSVNKLLPALYYLDRDGRLPGNLAFVGVSRRDWSTSQWHSFMQEELPPRLGKYYDEIAFKKFVSRFSYVQVEHDQREHYDNLKAELAKPREGVCANIVFYLAIAPADFTVVVSQLDAAGLSGHLFGNRIVLEKPFGHDLDSALHLNQHLHRHFDEEQIFRIDHYLGKETVQNLLVFRFANSLVEPIWNRNYIDHVQITVAEKLGVGDRGGYYDQAGALRDMVQNHVMQLVALTAMEPPVAFDAKAVRDQKVNVMHSIRPLDPAAVQTHVVRAQYGAGMVNDKPMPGYLETKGIAPNSTTDTYLAWKLEIDNWRWNGVPFYLRTGKAMATKLSEINIIFRKPPLLLFENLYDQFHLPSNILTLRIQPDESITLSFDAKRPGPVVEVDPVQMSFSYNTSFGPEAADAYERLLLDALVGDGTLFIRRDEIEVAWDRVTRIMEGWHQQEAEAARQGQGLRLPQYTAGAWGPQAADELLKRDHRYWRNVPAKV